MSCNMSVHIEFMTCLMKDRIPGVPVRNQTDLSSIITYLASFYYLPDIIRSPLTSIRYLHTISEISYACQRRTYDIMYFVENLVFDPFSIDAALARAYRRLLKQS